ncbi:MAG: hypothetical protein ACYC35_24685 [Pirellulales bacterium]
MKRAIFIGLISAALTSSTGCGLLRGILCGCGGCGDCGACGPACGAAGGCGCSDCGSGCEADCGETCGPACGARCGCGPVARHCGAGCTACGGWGCGDRYWGDFYSDPPEVFDPCDNCGNYTGRSSSGYAGSPQPAYVASANHRARRIQPPRDPQPTLAQDDAE